MSVTIFGLTIARKEQVITKVKRPGNGYVHVVSRSSWAQMPEHIWDSLKRGEKIPDEYVFTRGDPCLMPILVKGKIW